MDYSMSHLFRWPSGATINGATINGAKNGVTTNGATVNGTTKDVSNSAPVGGKPHHLPGLFDIEEFKQRHQSVLDKSGDPGLTHNASLSKLAIQSY